MRLARLTALTTLALALLAAPLAAEAQPAPAVPRIGWILVGTPSTSTQNIQALRLALTELGYTEGRNIALEIRYAEGRFERVPILLDDLLRHRVDVILVGGYQLISAAKRATSSVPIVGASCGVELFAETLARPGGNITGVACMSPDLATKQLQLLLEVAPPGALATVLYNPQVPYATRELRELEQAANTLGKRLHAATVSQPAEIEPAFAAMKHRGTGAVLVVSEPMTYSQRHLIAELALRHQIAVMGGFRDYALAGSLLSYGSNLQSLIRRAATYIDRILKGAKPGDLPIEQPTKFEFVINLKTAKALGLTIPPAVLARADEIIQ